MVRIRLSRLGRPHRPFYRVSAIDQRTKRDGKVIEPLGWYDPMEKDAAKALNLNVERIKFWLASGAQPSETLKDLFAKHSIINADERKAELSKRVEHKKKLAAIKAAHAPKEGGEKKEAAAS